MYMQVSLRYRYGTLFKHGSMTSDVRLFFTTSSEQFPCLTEEIKYLQKYQARNSPPGENYYYFFYV